MKKVALITGSAKRIGKLLALALARDGWDIALHYHQSTIEAEALADQLRSGYPYQQFETFQTDLSILSDTELLIPNVLNQFGQLHLLINSASIFKPAALHSSQLFSVEEHFKINLEAPLLLMRDFYNYGCKGQIINLLDSRIVSNKGDYFVYSLTKKSLRDATVMAALEFAPRVRVNAIALGAVLPPEGKDSTYFDNIVGQSPLQLIIDEDSMIRSVNYLIDNEVVTGQILFLDSGSHLL